MAEGFISDLIGVHDLRDQDGTILPRRNVLTVVDGNVQDDPVNGETVIAFKRSQTVSTVSPGGNITLTNVDADLYRVGTPIMLQGLGAPTVYGKRLAFIANASGSSVTIMHNESAAAPEERFITATGENVVLPEDTAALVIHDGSAWRLVT